MEDSLHKETIIAAFAPGKAACRNYRKQKGTNCSISYV